LLERWRRRGGGDVDRAWATLLADRNNALGLEAAEAREAAAGAAWEREAAREDGTARMVEVAELDLWDAARQGGRHEWPPPWRGLGQRQRRHRRRWPGRRPQSGPRRSGAGQRAPRHILPRWLHGWIGAGPILVG